MTVFFEIDGVLNTREQWTCAHQLEMSCIKEFCWLVNSLEADVVLMSTTWKSKFLSSMNEGNGPHLKALERVLNAYGIRIRGKTKDMEKGHRDAEVRAYVKDHGIKNYIIIDHDRSAYANITEHNHFVDSYSGMSKKDRRELKNEYLSIAMEEKLERIKAEKITKAQLAEQQAAERAEKTKPTGPPGSASDSQSI